MSDENLKNVKVSQETWAWLSKKKIELQAHTIGEVIDNLIAQAKSK